MTMDANPLLDVDAHDAYINRELSWLAFARRVLEIAEDESQPLLERVKFAGIMGMIFDEFVMKRLGGLHQKLKNQPGIVNLDGLRPGEELQLCRAELQRQTSILGGLFEDVLRPALARESIFLPSYDSLTGPDKDFLQKHFEESVLPILTPLAVDAAHPFPFISNLSINLAVVIDKGDGHHHFVRLKVPANRRRWVALPDNRGFVRLEEIQAEPAAGPRHHQGAVPGKPGRGADFVECPRALQPAGRCAGAFKDRPGIQYSRPVPGAQPDIQI